MGKVCNQIKSLSRECLAPRHNLDSIITEMIPYRSGFKVSRCLAGTPSVCFVISFCRSASSKVIQYSCCIGWHSSGSSHPGDLKRDAVPMQMEPRRLIFPCFGVIAAIISYLLKAPNYTCSNLINLSNYSSALRLGTPAPRKASEENVNNVFSIGMVHKQLLRHVMYVYCFYFSNSPSYV